MGITMAEVEVVSYHSEQETGSVDQKDVATTTLPKTLTVYDAVHLARVLQ